MADSKKKNSKSLQASLKKRRTQKTASKETDKAVKRKRQRKQKNYLVRPARYLLLDTINLWRENKGFMWKFTALYGAFYFMFVRALTSFDVQAIRNTIELYFGSSASELTNSLILTGAVFGLSIELNDTSGTYALVLAAVFSMAILWLLRHIWLGKRTTIKEAFYSGMAPLVPTLIIIGVIALQMLPLSIGVVVLTATLSQDIADLWWEIALVITFLISMLILSGYWITGSILAYYITTVPGMTPMRSLRSAKEILKGRRLLTLQKIIIFMIFTGVVSFGLLFSVVWVAESWALVAVTAISVLTLPWFHSYMFTLYRSLLDD